MAPSAFPIKRPIKRNLIGQKFGKLTVVSLAGRDVKSNVMWECRCDCGNVKNFYESKLLLKNNPTRSCGCVLVLPHGEAAMNKLYYGYTRDALRRGYTFDLSKKEFKILTKSKCIYCGSEPKQKAGEPGNNGYYIFNGIDRIDNNKGYNIQNVVACCKMCNRMKWDTNKNEFLSHIKKILNYQKGEL